MALIYLDYAASCPVDPRVVKAMEPMWSCGNAASGHQVGEYASNRLEAARDRIAGAIGAKGD